MGGHGLPLSRFQRMGSAEPQAWNPRLGEPRAHDPTLESHKAQAESCCGGRAPTESHLRLSHKVMGVILPPNGIGRLSIKPKMIVLEPLGLMLFALLCFRHTWGSLPLSSFLLLDFGMGMPTLCPSHSCILEAHYVFGFTDSQLRRKWPQHEARLESHPYLI